MPSTKGRDSKREGKQAWAVLCHDKAEIDLPADVKGKIIHFLFGALLNILRKFADMLISRYIWPIPIPIGKLDIVIGHIGISICIG